MASKGRLSQENGISLRSLINAPLTSLLDFQICEKIGSIHKIAYLEL